VVYWNDPELIVRPCGAIEALVEAEKQGKTRFIGFTGHKHPEIHLHTLEFAEKHGIRFDSVQMPLNAFDATFRSFEQHVLPAVRRHGAAALGMKSLGGGGRRSSRVSSPSRRRPSASVVRLTPAAGRTGRAPTIQACDQTADGENRDSPHGRRVTDACRKLSLLITAPRLYP
jgi:aryl-alcohol dehydrogenase-like predicted oxidoreductase